MRRSTRKSRPAIVESNSDDEDNEPLAKKPKTPSPPKNKTPADADDSSSESDIENYLQPADKINLNSTFFNLPAKNPQSFEKIEKKMFDGVTRLSDSSSSDEEMENPVSKLEEVPAAVPVFQSEDNTSEPMTFHQMETFTRQMEEAKKQIALYEAKKKKKEENLDISKLLKVGENVHKDNSLDNLDLRSSDFETCESDSDWEEIKVASQESPVENESIRKGLQIVVEMPDAVRKKKGVDLVMAMKRRLNRMRKENQVYVHKVHVLCWLGHGNYVNSCINQPETLAMALSLLPSENAYPSGQVDLKYIGQILKWYRGMMKINEKKSNDLPLDKELQKQISDREVSNEAILCYVFVAILRSLGIQCRLVLSLQVEPLKPPTSELHSLSTKDEQKVANPKVTGSKTAENTSTSKIVSEAVAKKDAKQKKVPKSNIKVNEKNISDKGVDQNANKNVEDKVTVKRSARGKDKTMDKVDQQQSAEGNVKKERKTKSKEESLKKPTKTIEGSTLKKTVEDKKLEETKDNQTSTKQATSNQRKSRGGGRKSMETNDNQTEEKNKTELKDNSDEIEVVRKTRNRSSKTNEQKVDDDKKVPRKTKTKKEGDHDKASGPSNTDSNNLKKVTKKNAKKEQTEHVVNKKAVIPQLDGNDDKYPTTRQRKNNISRKMAVKNFHTLSNDLVEISPKLVKIEYELKGDKNNEHDRTPGHISKKMLLENNFNIQENLKKNIVIPKSPYQNNGKRNIENYILKDVTIKLEQTIIKTDDIRSNKQSSPKSPKKVQKPLTVNNKSPEKRETNTSRSKIKRLSDINHSIEQQSNSTSKSTIKLQDAENNKSKQRSEKIQLPNTVSNSLSSVHSPRKLKEIHTKLGTKKQLCVKLEKCDLKNTGLTRPAKNILSSIGKKKGKNKKTIIKVKWRWPNRVRKNIPQVDGLWDSSSCSEVPDLSDSEDEVEVTDEEFVNEIVSSVIENAIPQLDGANDKTGKKSSSKLNLSKLKKVEKKTSSPRNPPKQLKIDLSNAEAHNSDDDFSPKNSALKKNIVHTRKVNLNKLSKNNNIGSPEKLDQQSASTSSQQSKYYSSVQKDIISLVKGRMAEQKILDKSKLVKRAKNKNESDSDSDYAPEPIKKKRRDSEDHFSPKVKVKRRVQVTKNSPGSRGQEPDDKSKQKKKGNDVWCEVYCESEQKWISVDVIFGKVDCVNEIYSRATHPITYIVGWNNNETIKDVTARYCSKNFNTVTRKLRADPVWLQRAIRPFEGPQSVRDIKEEEELKIAQLEQPLPKVISEYKNHPLYVLQRHLLKFEAIYPPDAPTLGFVRGEPVYSRNCVYTLHSRDIWLKQAKVVRLGEKPYKIVKARPKYDKLSNKVITDQLLEVFGEWQVQDYEPPTAENGIVPRNAFGNVDLFKPEMLPKKTVHMNLPGLNKIAKKLNIDCAPAIVGFDFHGGWSHPVYEGFVVCQEFEKQLFDAWEKEQEEQDRKDEEKIEKRVYGNWKRLIKGLLIRERLKARYDFGSSKEPDPPKKNAKCVTFCTKRK